MPSEARVIQYVRPSLKPYQIDAIFCKERFGVVEASTKSGKTYGCLCWLAEQAFLSRKRYANFSWCAPVYQQARIAYRRMRRYIPAALRVPNETELTLTLPNTNRINFFSGEKPDNIYGDDDEASVIDEASRLREAAYHAMLSRLTKTNGPMRIIGNVKGRKNWAYMEARKAEAGEPGMHFARVTAADAVAAGVLRKESIEDARRRMPEHVFNELFNAIPTDDDGNPFGILHIAKCLVPELSTSRSIAYGVDLAKSIDWTVILGLDTAGVTSTFERFQKPWMETLSTIKSTCGKTKTLVDSTGVGDPIVEDLQRKGLSSTYEGYKFTSESKQRLMEGLAVAIQSALVKFPDGPIRAELDAFEYEYTRTGVRYSAPEGMHDDCVTALALAWARYQSVAGKSPASSWSASEGKGKSPSWARPGM